jgi:ppGpp synthetase/RelA/SpoT-type nucleotidyltranferase
MIMKISKTQIDKAGYSLAKNTKDVDSFIKIAEWRALHSIPLQRLRGNISQYFRTRRKWKIITQRLKRMPTIINKIARMGGSMNLSRMQDIGGLRLIVKDMSEVNAIIKSLKNKRSDFSFVTERIDDYIVNPKSKDKKGGYAYRSIHIIYKSNLPDEDCHGLQVELQIRTKLQHYWATAVEVIDIIEKKSIKSGIGSEDWNDFFAITSSIFALKENCNVFEEHKQKSKEELISEFNIIEKRLGVIKKLEGISKIKTIGKFTKEISYALIILNIQNNKTEIIEFTKDEQEKAYNEYMNIEQKILNENLNQVALLASASQLQKLKTGYSAYFLDVQEFIRELREINNPPKPKQPSKT